MLSPRLGAAGPAQDLGIIDELTRPPCSFQAPHIMDDSLTNEVSMQLTLPRIMPMPASTQHAVPRWT